MSTQTHTELCCDFPGCVESFVVKRCRGQHDARKETFPLGWTVAKNDGYQYPLFKDYCPEHHQYGEKPSYL